MGVMNVVGVVGGSRLAGCSVVQRWLVGVIAWVRKCAWRVG